MGLPFEESKTLGGLYLRPLGNRIYAVTHGNAGFKGESHIRFTEGAVVQAPEPGKWTIWLVKDGDSFEWEIGRMSPMIDRAEDVPEGAVIIAEIEIE